MKKIIIAAAFIFLLCPGLYSADKADLNKRALISLIDEHRMEKGFKVTNVGYLGLSLMRTIASSQVKDPKERKILDLFKDVSKIIIVDYEEASASSKKRFGERASRIFRNSEKLFEVNEGGEKMDLYGTLSEDGKTVNDFVLFSPSGSALICVVGSISTDSIGALINQNLN